MNAPASIEPIHHSMLVSEISRTHPQCRPVFEKYGIAGCGGEFGPPEPLFLFAAAHRIALPGLVEELNRAARGEWKDDSAGKARAAEADAARQSETLYKRFVFGSLLVALTAGFGLGVVNLTRIAMEQSYYAISGVLKQVHGHAQIFGWVGLFVIGVSLHAVPRLKMTALRPVWAARWCFGLMLGGVFLRVFSQPWARNPVAAGAMVVSAVMELAAIGLFVWQIARVSLGSKQKAEFYEKYIWASVGWLAVLGVWNLWIVLEMARHRSVGVPALQDALWIHAAFFGFIANMIFGFSLRVLPHFLGLRDSKVFPANAAFVLWNTAILLRYPVEELAWWASALEAAAIGLFLWSLGIFARRRAKIEIKGVDRSFAWFIYLAYGWLLVAAVLPFHADVFRLSASARHTMALGFVTPMIFGVAYRVLPIFNGVNLWSPRLMRASFWCLALGSTLAFSMAVNKVFETPGSYAWSAAMGFLVLAALGMFALNLVMTLRTTAEPYTRGSTVTAATRVTELLEANPGLRPVLIHNGLAGLAAAGHSPPRFVTIEFAARRHGIDPGPLVRALNEEIQRRPVR